ncbi:phenylacetate-CoA oxygenase subunit PaaC [Acidiphilium sp. AL]|uniref:1,2-phenylacetyl-CoA epoxidase subunit PaaC n=1 Tax=Acidiphilium sp. AL TaxID=2871704 RepID=UPI0021CB09A0|nr:1,2-phenylacetyl-CoA epoxidase subunit PaaC [Acidiphilium sp. AL]MCU4160898.1 phenylacetate-CoA oxygenase subunit PaaC [Acidiphilium sp. AL]
MATTSIAVVDDRLFAAVLARADDALILGHRLAEWCGHAPMLEEDLALANIALDLIGQARLLYEYAATIENAGHTEDDYAYRRDPHQFRNILLVEQPNGDFAHTIIRQYLYSAFAHAFWQAMTSSADAALAAIAAKSVPESAYHLRHAAEWTIRLGDGTEESHRRAQDALDALFPYTGEMFAIPETETDLIVGGILADPATIRPAWTASLDRILAEAGLAKPQSTWMQSGGRRGRHSEHLGHLLAEMQILPRSYPGAIW